MGYMQCSTFTTEVKPKVLLCGKVFQECKENNDIFRRKYEIETYSAATFSQKMKEFMPDIVVLNDDSMTGGYGVDFLDSIKDECTTQHIKVLVVKDFNGGKITPTRHVADGYLSRPLSCSSLSKWLLKATHHKRNAFEYWGA